MYITIINIIDFVISMIMMMLKIVYSYDNSNKKLIPEI